MFLNIPSKELIKKNINNGLINKNLDKNDSYYKLSKNIGEFIDVLAVVYKLKPLAGLDFSSYGKKNIKKNYNINIINSIIKLCNDNGVKFIHNYSKKGCYLKTIFYLPENEQKAINLMKIIWIPDKFNKETPDIVNNAYYHYYIGKSFGYKNENIKYFLKRNFNYTLTNEYIKRFSEKMVNDCYTIENLNSYYRIEIKNKINLIY